MRVPLVTSNSEDIGVAAVGDSSAQILPQAAVSDDAVEVVREKYG